MKIIFQTNQLNKALAILSKAAQSKINSNLPGSIYIYANKERVELEANDFEIGIKVHLDAQVDEEGTMLLASKFFQDIIRKMPEKTVTLNQPEGTNTVYVTSGKAEFNMVTYNPNEFTLVEEITNEEFLKIDTADLKELIDLTTFAVSTDESRPLFTGALVEVVNDEISMVCTDTHRMAVKKIKNELQDNLIMMKSIIPAKILNEISRLLPIDEPQVVHIYWNKTQVAFAFENVYLISRLIEGQFPEYKNIIPQTFYGKAILNRKELMNAVERVSLFSKDVSYNAIRFDWTGDHLLLTSQNIDVGTAKEEIPCQYEGKDLTISFNGRYISDILKHGNGEKVVVCLTEKGPLVIRLDENPNYTYVATPIRTN